MEKNNEFDDLLIKYLANEVSEEERETVKRWIDASEESQRYFESIRNAWQLVSVKQTLDYVLDKMDVDEKWNRFKQTVGAKEAKLISINERQFEVDSFGAERSKRKLITKSILIRAAIAASLLLMLSLGRKFIFQDKEPAPVASVTEKKKGNPLAVFHHEVNSTDREKRIQLPDGSLIVLGSNSEITYQVPFVDKRDITLIGKADFKVAKDKTHPFTVFSGDIATTALGTEFTVTAFKNTSEIKVRLYEGKVVVRAVDKANKSMKKDVYLIPGDEFLYNPPNVPKVISFNSKKVSNDKMLSDKKGRDNPLIPQNTGDSWYMFNNQPLEDVFNELAAFYKVKIIYDKKDIQNINYVGKYNRSDSLGAILKRIAIIHNLTLTKTDSAFIISK